MDTESTVRQHYSRDDLEGAVLAALEGAGVDVSSLKAKDLGGLDHLHAGSVPSTEHVLDVLQLGADDRLLDVGCGVGGPARLAAVRAGCHVTGIDLSPDFVTLARSLTERVGLGHLVAFDAGSALDLPYPDGSFTRAMMNHVGMNIAAKDRVFAEVRRVLRPGGLFAVFEQMRVGDGALTFPMPWAEDESSSFVEWRARYVELLEQAGFVIDVDEDRAAAVAAVGAPQPGALTPAILFGAGFTERISNNITATMAGILSPILIVAHA